MQDLYWKIFSQTGNVETYLLIKEMEIEKQENSQIIPIDKQDSSVFKQQQ